MLSSVDDNIEPFAQLQNTASSALSEMHAALGLPSQSYQHYVHHYQQLACKQY